MRIDRPFEVRVPWRMRVLPGLLAALGLVAIVGSGGGGSLGFPPCNEPWCNEPPPPPAPEVRVDPPYVTALVGGAVTLTAVTANLSGSVSYAWKRSDDGGNTFVAIAGANARTYTLAGVNLGDDGAILQVQAWTGDGSVRYVATSRLTVSAVPGLVYKDGTFAPADWTASAVPGPAPTVPPHEETQVTSGGNPGAYRRMTVQIPAGAGSARVFHFSQTALYDPASQGAINVIDYSEDCLEFSGELVYTESRMAIEQGARRFIADTDGSCSKSGWTAAPARASLRAADFYLFDGPACPSGASCPDFSASGTPLRLGTWRITYGAPGAAGAHGIDNWKVTVWRR